MPAAALLQTAAGAGDMKPFFAIFFKVRSTVTLEGYKQFALGSQ